MTDARSTPVYAHVPAAFINALAEEGTKDEAIFWLQKQWNECCALRSDLEREKEEASSYHKFWIGERDRRTAVEASLERARKALEVNKLNAVKFEQLISFRPQTAALIYGREPTLRDMIFNYYVAGGVSDPDALTKKYIAELFSHFAHMGASVSDQNSR